MRAGESRLTYLLVVLAFMISADLRPNPKRNAYFGETHIHTSWSVDAIGNRLTASTVVPRRKAWARVGVLVARSRIAAIRLSLLGWGLRGVSV
jgi:hypothetical protein